jgi:dCMP deaminase
MQASPPLPAPSSARPRPSWNEYLLILAAAASQRSQDPWVQVGAISARSDYSIIGSGYNGPPPGCEIDWSNRDARRQFVIHAEVNALAHAKPGEVRIIASTLLPCPACLTMIASYGVKEVVYRDIYLRTLADSESIAKTFGLIMTRIPEPRVFPPMSTPPSTD